MDDVAQNTEQVAETTTETLSIGDLSETKFDTALTFGIIPLIIFAVLFIFAVIIFFLRRKNTWENAPDSAGDDDNDDPSFPSTGELKNMQVTEPAPSKVDKPK